MRVSISSADFPNMWPTPYNDRNRIYRGSSVPLPLVTLREASDANMPPDEITFYPARQPKDHYQAQPDEVPWEITPDMLGDRTGLRMNVRGQSNPNQGTRVSLVQQLQVWAHNNNPADVSANGKHFYTVTRSDGVIDVWASSNVHSTLDSFHVYIDLEVKINGMPHFQRRWV